MPRSSTTCRGFRVAWRSAGRMQSWLAALAHQEEADDENRDDAHAEVNHDVLLEITAFKSFRSAVEQRHRQYSADEHSCPWQGAAPEVRLAVHHAEERELRDGERYDRDRARHAKRDQHGPPDVGK